MMWKQTDEANIQTNIAAERQSIQDKVCWKHNDRLKAAASHRYQL